MEVVIGLTLMASVLVGSLLSFSAHQKQLRNAEAKIVAVTIADDLLNQFSGRSEGIPTAGRGPIETQPRWFWQTQIVGVTAPAEIPLRVIRLEVVEIISDGSLHVHCSVDVVETPS